MKLVFTCLLAFSLPFAACGGEGGNVVGQTPAADKTRLAFVTNCAVPFWMIAESGVKQAEKDFDVEVSVHMPPNGTTEEQVRILEDLMVRRVQGIALSPKNPVDMKPLIDRVAERTLLVTHDSDAPATKRLCYVGMDNYDAGRMCGRLIAESVPDGGAILIVVGTLDQDNARRRRQGLIDELFGRDHDPQRFDPQDAVLKAGKWEVRATVTDQFDASKTKAAAEDAMTRWADIKCMVGLFAYEPPVLLQAVEGAGRLGEIVIAAFDEDGGTLKGIADGKICGTIVQNPFEYGYRSIELLGKLVRAPDEAARKAILPDGAFIDIPARVITKRNVAEFQADLKQKTGAK